ncbi:DnaD domain-containing protein [Streptococcus fryi]
MTFFEQYQKGYLVLPSSLFFHYHEIFDNSDDFLVWQFLYLQNTTKIDEMAPSQIAKAIGKDLSEVNRSISQLTAKELLQVKTIELAGDMEVIFDASPALQKLDDLLAPQPQTPPAVPNAFKELVNAFEGEFGRLLTPIEIEDLQKRTEDGTPIELIKEALKVAVLNRKLNLNYIGAILRNWHNEGIKTLRQVEEKRLQRENSQTKTLDVSKEFAEAAFSIWSD